MTFDEFRQSLVRGAVAEDRNIRMDRTQQKKEAERRVLAAARIAGAPIPMREIPGEEPDFTFQIASVGLGIELSEVLRPASSNDGILPAEQEAFHESIMSKAQQAFQKMSPLPTRVNVYFSRTRGVRQDKDSLIQSLIKCVARHRPRANPAVVIEGDDLPEGYDHVLITAEPGDWWSGEGGGITLAEIPIELAAKINAKNKLVMRYRENLPRGAGLWLLLFSRPTVARSIPMPYGIERWTFPFDFDRVFWFASLENKIVEILRGEPNFK